MTMRAKIPICADDLAGSNAMDHLILYSHKDKHFNLTIKWDWVIPKESNFVYDLSESNS